MTRPLADEHQDYAKCRERWLSGLCPCCGVPLDARGQDPVPVAENVRFCGFCIGHADDPEHVSLVLQAILPGRRP
jgi:hypothetical protein